MIKEKSQLSTFQIKMKKISKVIIFILFREKKKKIFEAFKERKLKEQEIHRQSKQSERGKIENPKKPSEELKQKDSQREEKKCILDIQDNSNLPPYIPPPSNVNPNSKK